MMGDFLNLSQTLSLCRAQYRHMLMIINHKLSKNTVALTAIFLESGPRWYSESVKLLQSLMYHLGFTKHQSTMKEFMHF